MHKIINLISYTILSLFVSLFVLYICLVFILPLYINSEKFNSDVNSFLKNRYGIGYDVGHLKFAVSPSLKAEVKIDGFSLKDNTKNEIVSLSEFYGEYDVLKKHPVKIKINNLLFNFIPKQKMSAKKNFSLKRYYDLLSVVELKNSQITVANAEKSDFKAFIPHLSFSRNAGENKVIFNADITSPVLNNKIKIGENGFLYFSEEKLFSDNLSISFGNSKINIVGLLYGNDGGIDFSVNGDKVPVSELQSSLLYFQKLRKKDKVFIENFYDFSGFANIKLNVTNKGLFGSCVAENLAAKSVLFNVPILFKTAVFDFSERQINSYATGKLGENEVNSIFMLEGAASENQTVNGVIKSKLTNETVQKYIPDTKIKGSADTTVYYGVENHDVSVNYLLELNKNSDIYYKNANLGLEDKNRRLTVKTFKTGDILKIVSYDYSTIDNHIKSEILSGNGLFIKENAKLKLDYITCKTNDYAPVSVTGSFGEYLHGGVFKGDLKYNHPKKQITGNFSVKDSAYNDFSLKQASFSADNVNMNIVANGTYNNEIFNCKISAENDFGNKKIRIGEMKLFLDKFHIKKGGNKTVKPDIKDSEIIDKVSDTDISIDKWQIGLNEILGGNIRVEHVFLDGNLESNIFNFKSENAKFAGGILFAEGSYDFNNHSSKVKFIANDIDSDIASGMVFGLQNQVTGTASVFINAQTSDFFDKINAHAEFDIKQGFLPQLGSTEFIIKKSRKNGNPLKFKIDDIVNIDIKKEKALKSRIKGSFDIDDYLVDDIYITAQQQFLSFLIKGNYVIDKQEADLNLWGKYNKNIGKRVKILSVPLTWIVKIVFRPEKTKEIYKTELDEIPKIQACGDEEQNFRVKMKGNLNTKDVDVELKRIF